jgi:hypothetical protein
MKQLQAVLAGSGPKYSFNGSAVDRFFFDL